MSKRIGKAKKPKTVLGFAHQFEPGKFWRVEKGMGHEAKSSHSVNKAKSSYSRGRARAIQPEP